MHYLHSHPLTHFANFFNFSCGKHQKTACYKFHLFWLYMKNQYLQTKPQTPFYSLFPFPSYLLLLMNPYLLLCWQQKFLLQTLNDRFSSCIPCHRYIQHIADCTNGKISSSVVNNRIHRISQAALISVVSEEPAITPVQKITMLAKT